MADSLRAGFPPDLQDWDDPKTVSMAKDIETAMAALMPPLAPFPKDDKPDNRRLFFMAIAAGVINHLQKHQDAITVTVPDGLGGTGTVKVNPVISVAPS